MDVVEFSRLLMGKIYVVNFPQPTQKYICINSCVDIYYSPYHTVRFAHRFAVLRGVFYVESLMNTEIRFNFSF